MENTENNMQSPEDMGFGISADERSSNTIPFECGFPQAILTKVEAKEVGKNEKFFVLNFNFYSPDKNKNLVHTEFIPTGKANSKETEAENLKKNRQMFNSRIKHLYEAFRVFPENGIGKTAKNWNEFFTMIAKAFNEDNNGNGIYMKIDGEKKSYITVYLKTVYTKKGEISLPAVPNFIERIDASNMDKPKKLAFTNYDITAKPQLAPPANMMGSVPSVPAGGGQDMGF